MNHYRPPRIDLAIQDLETMFRGIDTNGDGLISIDELRTWITDNRETNWIIENDNQPVSEDQSGQIMRTYDSDFNRGLDLNEFRNLIDSLPQHFQNQNTE